MENESKKQAELLTNFEKMNESDFILIQVDEKDKFYELARVRPYFNENNEWDEERGWFCEGFGQNNGSFYEFSLHLGKDESDVKHKFINLGYPVKKYNGEKVRVSAKDHIPMTAMNSDICMVCNKKRDEHFR